MAPYRTLYSVVETGMGLSEETARWSPEFPSSCKRVLPLGPRSHQWHPVQIPAPYALQRSPDESEHWPLLSQKTAPRVVVWIDPNDSWIMTMSKLVIQQA